MAKDVTTTETYLREPEWMEIERRAALADAKSLVGKRINIPEYRVAGMSPEQKRAIIMASQGIGSYKPFLQTAGGLYGEAAKDYRGLTGYGDDAMSAIRKGMNRSQGYIDEARGGYQDVGGYAEDALGLSMRGTRKYDPNSVNEFMDPYQEAVTDNVMKNLRRESAIQQNAASSQAVSRGAFGGSRSGVQQAEMSRNLADVQGQTLAAQRSANYSQAQTAAMNAFQNQQARMQQAGQTALGAGQLQAQGAAGIAGLGQQQYTMGQGVGQMDLQAGQLQAQGAAGLANVGQQQSALGQQTSALGQGDTSFLYNMGLNLQGQNQKQLEAQRMNEQMYAYEPYQRMSYYADLLNKTPSGQMQTSQTTSPQASPWSSVLGLGTTALAAYNLYNK